MSPSRASFVLLLTSSLSLPLAAQERADSTRGDSTKVEECRCRDDYLGSRHRYHDWHWDAGPGWFRFRMPPLRFRFDAPWPRLHEDLRRGLEGMRWQREWSRDWARGQRQWQRELRESLRDNLRPPRWPMQYWRRRYDWISGRGMGNGPPPSPLPILHQALPAASGTKTAGIQDDRFQRI